MCDKNRKKTEGTKNVFQHNENLCGYANSKSNKILSKLPFFFFFILSSSPLLFSDGNIPSECFIWIFFFFCCFHVFVCRLMRQLTFNTCVTLAAPIRLPLLARTRSLHTKAQLNVSFSFFSNDSNKYVDVDETRSMWANWMEWICVVHVSLCDMSNVLQCTPPRYGARIVVIECGTVAWD